MPFAIHFTQLHSCLALMGIRKQLVVILLLMLGTCTQGQTISYNHKAHHSNTLKKNLSFNDMILIIAHQNPALKAISLNQELAKTHLETEKSNLWPQFSIGGSLQKILILIVTCLKFTSNHLGKTPMEVILIYQ